MQMNSSCSAKERKRTERNHFSFDNSVQISTLCRSVDLYKSGILLQLLLASGLTSSFQLKKIFVERKSRTIIACISNQIRHNQGFYSFLQMVMKDLHFNMIPNFIEHAILSGNSLDRRWAWPTFGKLAARAKRMLSLQHRMRHFERTWSISEGKSISELSLC